MKKLAELCGKASKPGGGGGIIIVVMHYYLIQFNERKIDSFKSIVLSLGREAHTPLSQLDHQAMTMIFWQLQLSQEIQERVTT